MTQLAIFSGLLLAAAPAGAVPIVIAHHGRLLSGEDAPIGGTHKLTVRFYRPAVQGQEQTPLWEEDYDVPVVDGVYTLLIGDTAGSRLPLDETIFDTSEDRYLALKVDDEAEMTPRLRVGSTIYALRAGDADKLGAHPPAYYSAASHTHTAAGVTDFDDASSAAVRAAGLPWSNVSGVTDTTEWPGSAAWTRVTGAPATFPPTAHAHAAADLPDLATPGTVNTGSNPVDWTKLKGVPAGIADGNDDGLTAVSVATGGGLTGAGTSGSALGIAPAGVTSVMLASDAGSLANVSGGAMAALSGGNVGIGTANPSYKLEVAGTARLGVTGIGNASATWTQFDYGGGGANLKSIIYATTGNYLSLGSNGAYDQVNIVGGNLGIGTTSPTAKLDVAGIVKATGTSFGMSYGRFEGSAGGTTGTRILPLGTTVVNTGGLTLASNAVTVSKTGVYLVVGFSRFDTKDSSAGATYLRLYKNGANEAILSHIQTVLGTGGYAVEILTLTGQTIVSLAANDTLSLYIEGDTQSAPYENRLTVVQLPN